LYPALAIRAFWVRRKNIKNLISSSNYDRYWRLMALASTDFCFTIPLTIRLIVTKRLAGVSPWVSWAHIHSGYSHIVQIPRSVVILRPLVASSYEVIRWTPVIAAFVAFAFLGLTSEARRNYRLLASTVAKSLGFALFTEKPATFSPHVVDHSLHFVPPVSITQQTGSRRDSDLSSDKLSTKLGPEVQSVKRPTDTAATGLSIDEVPRVPEPALDPDLVKRASVPDVSTPIYPGNALDRV
jgi:pheromone a factor receptor